MEYQSHQFINRQAAEEIFSSKEIKNICEVLVSVALNEPDWRWVQDKCLDFLCNENSDVRGIAATCLGHIARVHRQLDKEKVLVALREHLDDSAISGQVEDAIDDINMYLQ